jgi:hypothetical protein
MAPRNTRVSPETQVRSPARSFVQSLDNFYTPERDRRSEQAFQQGLGEFSDIFEAEAARVKGERRENEHQQGVADALREQAGQELEGVKTGSIFRQHSRYYMMGLNETRGKAAAAKFKHNLTLAYQDWEGKHTDDDGASFRDWMNGQVADFVTTLGDNEHMIAGAMPTINEVAVNFATQHTSFTANRLETESFEAYDEIISGVFSDLHNGTIDMDEAVIRLSDEADDMYMTDGAKANNRVVDAAIRYANIHNDPDAILALAKAHDAGSLKLSQVNREKLANAMDAVEADIQREESRQNDADKAAAEAAQQAALAEHSQIVANDPYAQPPAFHEIGDYQTYTRVVKLYDNARSAQKVKNPTATAQQQMGFAIQFHNASSPDERLSLISRGIENGILDASSANKYTEKALSVKDPNSLLNHTAFTRHRQAGASMVKEFSTDQYVDANTLSSMSTMYGVYYDEYLMAQTGKVDLTDPRAIREVQKAAKEYAMESLAFEFPNQFDERTEANQENGLSRSLGAEEAQETRDEAIQKAAEEEFRNLAGGDEAVADGLTNAMPVSYEGDADLEGDDLPLEEQPTPFEDSEDDNAYTPNRMGFYGELVHRFTDGEDTRDLLRSAAEIMSTDTEFANEVHRLSDKYDVNPNALLAVMDFESGIDPTKENMAGSGATGLIQFMPKTAASLGTTTEQLAGMTRAQQMVYVEKYLDQFPAIQGGNIEDIYMAVLWPKAIGKDAGYPLFRQGTIAYKQNAGLDTNKDGTVTKFEAAAKVKQRFYGY